MFNVHPKTFIVMTTINTAVGALALQKNAYSEYMLAKYSFGFSKLITSCNWDFFNLLLWKKILFEIGAGAFSGCHLDP